MASIRSYYLGEIPVKQVFRGQAKLIVDALQGTTKENAKTTVDLAVSIKTDLVTRQEPERVVAFYMSIWKKKGWVKSVDIAATASEAARVAGVEGTPQNVHEETGGIHADEHNEIRMETAIEEAHQKKMPDLRGKKLSEAVVEVLNYVGKPQTPEEITLVMTKNGYEFTLQQVQTACNTLERKGKAIQSEGLVTLTVETA